MISVQIDSFVECYLELLPLFRTHHAELGLFKDRMPLEPDLSEYAARERSGRLFMTTVRQDGAIVAYYVAQVATGFHYKSTLTAHSDIYYVVPEFRDRGLARPLFKAVERELQRRGVQVWYSGNKIHNPLGADRLHEIFGFVQADLYWAKWIGD